MTDLDADIVAVMRELQDRLEALPPDQEHRRAFIATYRRTTEAVGRAIAADSFEDRKWVSGWAVAFARYFLAAHDGDRAGAPVPRPWRLAFAAPDRLHRLVHLLLGMNAHINYDLPQTMLEVISDLDFADATLLQSRNRDHERIVGILGSRIAAEDQHLAGTRRLRDRLLTPVNRWASRRFLREARRSVWHNVGLLHEARRRGPATYAARVAELDVLASAKIEQLLQPGQVLLRLAVVGFGVRLPAL